MAMTRRNLLEAGLGGMALLAQGAALATPAKAGSTAARGHDTAADLSTVVIACDGSSTAVGGQAGAWATGTLMSISVTAPPCGSIPTIS